MKRIISILLLTALAAVSATGCSVQKNEVAEEKLKIVTTVFPQYDFARQIAGDDAQVSMLLKPGSESHSYEPSPQDIKTIQNADLFVYTGGENDAWIDGILNSMGDKKPDTLKLIDCVPIAYEETVEGMEDEDHDHAGDGHKSKKKEEAEKKEIDEHVWTSPRNAIAIVEKMASEIGKKDELNAKKYAYNAKAYVTELETVDSSFKEVVKNSKRKTVVFGDRFPFRYFADEYGLTYYAAFPGCSSETEASAATVSFLINKVKKEKIPVILVIELSSGKIADSVCEATGASKMTFYSCHNVTKEEFERGETYAGLMKKNVETLRKALQ